MFKKIKRILGIEGVKIELVLPEEVSARSGVLEGKIQFYSMNTQEVKSVRVKLIEKYTRGRGKEKLIDEYELGAIEMEQVIKVPEHEMIEIDFSLPFSLVKSDMDEFGDKNFLYGGLAWAAKRISSVGSDYRVEAEATVKGTALNPIDKKSLKVKR